MSSPSGHAPQRVHPSGRELRTVAVEPSRGATNMIDAYVHLDVTADDPVSELDQRLTQAGVRRALVVETWVGTEKGTLEEMASPIHGRTDDRLVAFCYRGQELDEISTLLEKPAVRALRARTASLEAPGPWLEVLEKSGRMLLCHGELGVGRLVRVLLRVRAEHPRLRIYVPHLAWPRRDKVDDPEWMAGIAILATLPNFVLGVSGLASFSSQAFPHDDVHPFVDKVLTSFDAERIVAATDFPFIEKSLYSETYHLARGWIQAGLPSWSDHDAFG